MCRVSLAFVALAFAFPMGTLCMPASAATIVHDDFDDNLLDPAWIVTFEDASGWTYVETGTELIVTDILATVQNMGSGGTWAKVKLTRGFAPTSDFAVEFRFAWDSAGLTTAMQYLYINLLDAGGDQIARSGFNDAWFSALGRLLATAGTDVYSENFNSQPEAGGAVVTINRTSGLVETAWNGTVMASDTVAEPLTRVQLEFGYYDFLAFVGINGVSTFGTESVDLVSVTGTPIRAPAAAAPLPSAALLGLGLLGGLGLVSRLRRRRATA